MLELIRCHCKGKRQDWSSSPLPGAVFPVVYDSHPLVELEHRRQLALKLSCQTRCQRQHGCKGLADAKRWPCKWFMVKLASKTGAMKLE